MKEQEIKDSIVSQLSKLSGEQLEAIMAYLQILTGEDIESKVSNQYLTFWCGNQLYGLEISQVVQIVQMTDITPLPDFPDYVKGILPVRGEMVPIMDLHLRLGLKGTVHSDSACIILTHIDSYSFGIIVDGVNDVATITEQDICTSPQSEHRTNYLPGIAQVMEGVEQISSVVQTNSATSEESAAASEELSSQASLIKELLSKFTLRSSDYETGSRPLYQGEEIFSDQEKREESFAKY